MLPIRDHNPSGRTPYVTQGLIALNTVIFLTHWPVFTDAAVLNAFYGQWALFPADVTAQQNLETLLTSMFLHGSLMHLLGNMLFLWIFGDNLEDVMGPFQFLQFYVVSGLAAAVAQVLAAPYSDIPIVGASGAIAGVMGGYVLLFPRARVDVLLILFVFLRVITIPAWLVLGLWFILQLFSGLGSSADTGGVAYWAHAGGFAAGALLMLPRWRKLGGTAYWEASLGAPRHPAPKYRVGRTDIPRVRRKR